MGIMAGSGSGGSLWVWGKPPAAGSRSMGANPGNFCYFSIENNAFLGQNSYFKVITH